MLSRLRDFDFAALAFVGLSVVALYALVLGRGIIVPAAVEGIAARPAIEAPITEAPPALEPRNAQYTGMTGVSVAGLVALFERADYRLDSVRKGEIAVPRILVDAVPHDFGQIRSPAKRKRVFIQMTLPLVLYVNERILDQRRRLANVRDEIARSGRIADSRDRLWLDSMARLYGLDAPDIDALMTRVDVIPPSLALAQGAEESGWGTSRFVREGNAIFGQRTFTEGAGLVPARRDDGKSHEVRAFDWLIESVASYVVNLNSHFAYDAFRRERAEMRRASVAIDGWALAGTLDRYSERREAYIETIRAIIDINRLRGFDRVRLGAAAATGDPDV